MGSSPLIPLLDLIGMWLGPGGKEDIFTFQILLLQVFEQEGVQSSPFIQYQVSFMLSQIICWIWDF